MKLFLRKIRYILVIVFVLLAAYLAKGYFFTSEEEASYITVTASKSDIEQTVLADASLKAFKQVNVGAQVSGQINRLYVELGDKVTKGQIIADIDDLAQQNHLKDAKAALEILQAQISAKTATLKSATSSYERQQRLMKNKVGTQADFEEAEAALEAARADLEILNAQIVQAQIAVDTAELDLSYTKITSPIDGVVVAIPIEEGQTVNAVQSAPTIVKVAQLDTMTVEAEISEADVIKVKEGMPVSFTILGEPNYVYHAKLRSIEPAPESINSESTESTSSSTTAIYYNGLFDIANPEGKLRISMTAQVRIILASAKDVIVLPSTALNHYDDKGNATINVVVENGEIVTKQVKVGINNNVDVEILSGIEVGDEVIITEGSAIAKNVRMPRMPRM